MAVTVLTRSMGTKVPIRSMAGLETIRSSVAPVAIHYTVTMAQISFVGNRMMTFCTAKSVKMFFTAATDLMNFMVVKTPMSSLEDRVLICYLVVKEMMFSTVAAVTTH